MASVLTSVQYAEWVQTAIIIFVCVAELNSPEQRKDNRDGFVIIIVTLFHFTHMYILCIHN